jgi:antitoxin component YwqK of YwqJK toxin-antitoxin module
VFWLYAEGHLTEIRQDDNDDGDIDLEITYESGQKKKLVRDRDHDNRFEITQWFDRPPWDYVTEVDGDGDGTVDERYFFKAGVLRSKEWFDGKASRSKVKAYYDDKGNLQKSEKYDAESVRPALTWMYNESGEPVAATKDRDGDGQVDLWFAYENGRIVSVEEDANGDGKIDIWETYDESEQLVIRKKDIDFDGMADIEERK